MVDHFNIFLYIDPGTGSMLLTVILGVLTTLLFAVRGFFIKIKVRLQGGKVSEDADRVPIVIFSDHKRYWNVFEDVCNELEKRKQQCLFLTCSADDPALSQKYEYIKTEYIGEGSKAFVRLNMLKADIVLATTPGLDVLQWKRSKNVKWYVHMYHTLGDGLGYRMFSLDYYDAVLTTGYVAGPALRKMEEMRGTEPKEIVVTGSTMMDHMYRDVQKLPVVKNEITTVLLAPSWGESSILNRLGENFINKLVDTGYKIIIRPHPQSKVSEKPLLESLQKKFPNGDKLEWNFDNDNTRVLSESDIMISDYSGVMFDYTFLFGKPFLYADTSFNKDPYEAAWFDTTPWLFAALPQLGVHLEEKDFDRIKEVIDQTISSETFKANREKLRDESWAFRGEAAVRTVDYLMKKREEL